jgi:hypothetical protein
VRNLFPKAVPTAATAVEGGTLFCAETGNYGLCSTSNTENTLSPKTAETVKVQGEAEDKEKMLF